MTPSTDSPQTPYVTLPLYPPETRSTEPGSTQRPMVAFLRGVFRPPDVYRWILLGCILLYIWLFTRLAFVLHMGMRTHKADLGQIAQAVWNSSRGRFMEMTDNGFIATRMTDHVEPILALISPILWLWDDVRALLWLQVLFVAAGGWLLYELTLLLLDRGLTPEQRSQIWVFDPHRQQTRPLALALVIAYLLAPQLQSALLTEFHAIPLAVPLILWSFWAIADRRWGQFVVATLLVAAVKEEAALLAAGLGMWALWRIVLEARMGGRRGDRGISWRTIALALGVTLASVIWFYIATFVIVPAHAAAVYGVAESSYFNRYGALGNSPLDILRNILFYPALVWEIATEPARSNYLWGLLVPFGFLSLLAPEILLLSLPVLLANLLSAYPAQYYGEFHYSAPVLVYFAVAASYGLSRLWRWSTRWTGQGSADFQHMPAAGITTVVAVSALRNTRTVLRPLMSFLLVLWILGWALSAYRVNGRGPLGGRYDPTPVTAHHQLIPRFTSQIPANAPLTATAAVHPHVSHRHFIYQFPAGLDAPIPADWALLDVTTATDMAPGDVKTTVEAMLAGEWGVVDAADGFLLLHKGEASTAIPDEFYNFARVAQGNRNLNSDKESMTAAPLTFMGSRVDDWPRWRQSRIVTTWQVGPDYDGSTMHPQIELHTPAGETLYRFANAMPPALLWYPPARWQPRETIHITTLPLYLPHAWGLIVEPTPGLEIEGDASVTGAPIMQTESGALVAAYVRAQDGELRPLPENPFSAELSEVVFSDWPAEAVTFAAGEFYTAGELSGEEQPPIQVIAWTQVVPFEAHQTLNVWLEWQSAGDGTGTDGETNLEEYFEQYDVFVHLRREDSNVSQNDGAPRYFVPVPPNLLADQSQEQTQVTDWRQLYVPLDALNMLEFSNADTEPTPSWQVVIGLYDPEGGARASVRPLDDSRHMGTNADTSTELVIATLRPAEPPIPDQACALNPATCPAQPR